MYITIQEVKGLLGPDVLEDVSDAVIEVQIAASKDMVDGFCNKSFPDGKVPSIVKSVSLDLVRVLLMDVTKQSESIGGGDYSYTQNNKAFEQILARLKYVLVDEDTVGGHGKAVKARVI